MNDTTTELVDRIDDLVDAQLAQEASGYDHNLAQARCPHCGRDWHGLAVTERLEQMRRDYQMRQHMQGLFGAIGEHGYAESVVDPDYRYTEDYSPVLCPGSAFIGPRPPTAMERSWGSDRVSWQTRLQEAVDAMLQPLITGPAAPYLRSLMDITVGDRIGYDLGDGVVHVQPATAEDVATMRRAAVGLPALSQINDFTRRPGHVLERERGELIPPPEQGMRGWRNIGWIADETLRAVDGAPYVWGGDGSVIDEGRQTAAPDPDPEPAPSDGRPPVPRPSHRPPMWANSPQSQRRNRRGGRP